MHVYTDAEVDPPRVKTYLNHTSSGTPFAVINLGDRSTLHLHSATEADALIAAAVEAKRLLSPPVITDSERDCDKANPASGAWCHRSGDHTEHRDTDGETWPAGQGGVLFPAGDDDEALTAVTA